MFHLCFHMYVANVFIWMLHMFHTYVASVLCRYCVCLQWFSSVCQVFQICLLLYVAGVAFECFKSRSDECNISPSCQGGSDFRRCFSPLRRLVAAGRPRPCSSGQRRLEATLIWVPPGSGEPTWEREMAREADCRHGRPNVLSVRTSRR
jgi:hypothetical protein